MPPSVVAWLVAAAWGAVVLIASFAPLLASDPAGSGEFVVGVTPGTTCLGLANCAGGGVRSAGFCDLVVAGNCGAAPDTLWVWDDTRGLVNPSKGVAVMADVQGKAIAAPRHGLTQAGSPDLAPSALVFLPDADNPKAHHLWFPQVAAGGPALGTHTGAFLVPAGKNPGQAMIWASAPNRAAHHDQASALYPDFSIQAVPKGARNPTHGVTLATQPYAPMTSAMGATSAGLASIPAASMP